MISPQPETPKVSLDAELRNAAAKLRSLANAATPGPWGLYESGYVIEIAADLEETGHGYRARRGICRLDEEPLDNDPAHKGWMAEEDWAQVQADAAYIAALHPGIALALAQLLDVEADVVAARIAEDGTEDYAADYGTNYLLDAARLINGEETSQRSAEATPFPPYGGHDPACAYVSGMTTRCTCSSDGGAR
ncbi:hypothetical protein [Streptomyces sp. MN13]